MKRSKDKQPLDKKDRLPISKKKAAALGLAAVSLASTAALFATGSSADKKPIATVETVVEAEDNLSEEEKRARAEAREAFEKIDVDDIVSCKISEIGVGPTVLYQGNRSPSMEVTVDVEPGTKYNDPLYSDEGQRTDDYWAEFSWSNPTLDITHTLKTDEGEEFKVDGAMIPLERYQPDKNFLSQRNSPLGDTPQIDNSTTQRVTYLVPFNDTENFQGTRTVALDANVNFLTLMEDWPGKPKVEQGDSKQLSQRCVTMEVEVRDGGYTIVSAEDTEGRLVKISDM